METALQIAQKFNKDVLKGQLNPNGDEIKRLARMIDEYGTDQYQQGLADMEY